MSEETNRGPTDKERREFMVGLVVLVSLVVLVFGTLWLQGSRFGRPQTEVHALVESAGGLRPGNTVEFRGVAIGRVGFIQVEPGATAVRVQLFLDGLQALAPDVAVLIAPESMFGDWKAELVTRSAFPTYDYMEVPPAATVGGVPVISGALIPDLSRLTAVADEVAQNIESLTSRFDQAFSDSTAAQLAQAVDNIERLTETLNRMADRTSEDIPLISEQLRDATASVSSTLESIDGTLARFDTIVQGGDVDSILSNTATITGNLVGVSDDVSAVSESLQSTLVRADSTMARLDRITATIESGEGSVGRLLYDATAAHELENILLQVNLLIEDLRANPRKYVRLSIF